MFQERERKKKKERKQKSNMHAEGGTNSNPVQSILVCSMCKHCNPIQNALNLLKGTISVTQWITFFFTLNNVTELSFKA